MTVRPRISVIRVDLDGVSGGGTGAAFTLNASTGSVSLVAGANITLNSNLSTITIIGGAGAGANFTLNASTGSVSLVAGAGIGFASNASTITISNSSPNLFSTISLSASGNTTSSSSGTWNNVLAVSGAGIISAGVGNGSITISATTPSVTNYSTITATMAGNTLGAASTTLTVGNSLSISGAGAVSVGASAGTITISAPIAAGAATQSFSGGGTSITGEAISVALFGGNNISLASASGAHSLSLTFNASSNALANVSLLNASSGAMSISAGAGIGIGQANSTITISASVQTANHSLSASGNTTGATSSGTYGSVLAVSGMGIVSVGAGNGTISISATTPSVTNFSTISLSASGNTTGASSGTMNNVLALSGAGIVSVGAGAGGSFTISATTPTVTNYSTISGNIAGNTAGSSTFTIGNTLQISLTGGLSGTASGSSITLSGAAAAGGAMSFTQNNPLQQAAGTIVSKSGTITGTAGIGSSLFLHRIQLASKMNVSEIDVAMSIGFNATNNGQGTISRSLVLYSFGNATSLASVMSVSGTSAWTSGTATAGGSASLTQFQGGWSSPLIQPMTFASTSVGAGEYVVGQLFNFAQSNSTWTINLYGAAGQSTTAFTAYSNAATTNVGTGIDRVGATAFSAGPTAFNALSSSALAAGSGITGISSIGSQFWPMMLSHSFTGGNSMSAFTLSGASSAATSNTKALNASIVAASASAQMTILGAIGNSASIPLYSVGTIAGSVFTASSSGAVVSLVQTSGFLVATALQVRSFPDPTATSGYTVANSSLPNFGYIGTGSTTSGLPTQFIAGIMSTGAIPVAITVTSNAVTYSGSAAFQQPWFALIGA